MSWEWFDLLLDRFGLYVEMSLWRPWSFRVKIHNKAYLVRLILGVWFIQGAEFMSQMVYTMLLSQVEVHEGCVVDFVDQFFW